MARLELKNINKIYPDGAHIIKDANLTIEDGEFTVFVGPSGCGKSTMLRMVAGLEEISSGEMCLDGEVVNNLSPTDRGIGMVFQSYALYPHMTVYENIAFGLKLAKKSKEDIDSAVRQVAEMLELTNLLKQKPSQLSGGQRQRVAIGRAIVRNPKLFLLDEPLSNLDASLRVRMRLQLAEYHQKLKSTVIYVTHDQVEAMTLADKIVVLRAGVVEQVGSPLELYYFPQTLFVAGFIGSPKMNLLPATLVEATGDQARVEVGDYTFEADVDATAATQGALMTLGIRPEDIHLDEKGVGVIVEGLERLGTESLLYTTLVRGGQEVLVRVPGTVHVEIGQRLNIRIPAEKCHLFDSKGLAFKRGKTIDDLITLPPQIQQAS
ncbi:MULTISPECIES: ABC transporter ATP-binding protein [Vibrio]|jgi:ABC-type sugar transport system ATPase subunit|uniref:ABC transporter n=1 Tax=Vibrio coralliilyticus TaxID=190893 RepID=A0AAP6ZI22_9VIBR|nr:MULTISPECIES: sn-glycerol-3-phosphate ABC transporter ATP-binding protein UgpC [Vibrio]AIW21036.1 ABC transporter [Vibrio coralliilyticus]AXN34375.1 sn-glycerol-3-phosphate ABC transporter ATP-binding protein UgpC [Vibrio coralliilyticus]EEX32208.1 ABC transporter [Vibrio coralliilyticus ATCC BAA-450]KPH24095.1 ABC transporter [Vibrio coralliilyticus]MCG9596048.1 sn-glycerol-3-phosphate ABC transporter ATP-binding protein UgpC [Vibrio sp. Isolate25]